MGEAGSETEDLVAGSGEAAMAEGSEVAGLGEAAGWEEAEGSEAAGWEEAAMAEGWKEAAMAEGWAAAGLAAAAAAAGLAAVAAAAMAVEQHRETKHLSASVTCIRSQIQKMYCKRPWRRRCCHHTRSKPCNH